MRRPRGPFGGHTSHLFHGVEITSNAPQCPAILAMAHRRFLSDEAPSLPIIGCDRRKACRCIYKHFTDRRTEVRRESDIGLPARFIENDRRSGRPRRVTDR
jgi:hypothetical protein